MQSTTKSRKILPHMKAIPISGRELGAKPAGRPSAKPLKPRPGPPKSTSINSILRAAYEAHAHDLPTRLAVKRHLR